MNITIIGAGYVGLVSAGCLAELGHYEFIAEVVANIKRDQQAEKLENAA